MSKVALTGNDSGTGTVTVESPNTNIDRTLMLPDASGTLVTSDQVYVGKNKILNGKMEINQRNSSYINVADGQYTLDRWAVGKSGTMAATCGAGTAVPTNEFNSNLFATITTADTSIAAGDYFFFYQRIEGYNARCLLGNTFTVSFWVKSPVAGIHCVAFSNTGFDHSYVTEYTIANANTWEYHTVTVNGGLINTGTWDWTTGYGVQVSFVLAAGSTYQTTAGAWQTGNFRATANQVNAVGVTGDFVITGVQLELGADATAFEHRPYQMEMDLCQRYYEFGTGYYVSYASSGASLQRTWVPFKNTKRTTPSVSLAITTGSLTTPTAVASRVFGLIVGFAATGAGVESEFSWTAGAEL